MVDLVALLQPAQDGDGRLDARLADQHLLEAALERGVLLDVLAVFVKRGGADAMQLAARQSRLQHVAGVDRALGLSDADHGMQLVDEDDGVALVLGQLLQHRLQALLELAAVLRPGEQRRQVEHQQALVLQALGRVAVDDALRQAFDDRGLADARLADQHRVVLGAALQDLDAAADLVVAADDRVELALAGPVGQVERVLRESLALPLVTLGRNCFSTPDLLDGFLKQLPGNPGGLQDPSGLPLVRRGGQEEQLRGNVLVAALLRFLVGDVKELSEVTRQHYLARGAFHLGQARNGVGKSLLESIRISARLADKTGHSPVLLAQESGEQVLGLHVLVVLAQRIALRLSEVEKLLAEHRIDEVVISDQRITGKLKSAEGGKTVAVANLVPPDLAERLSKYDVKYTRVYESTFLRDLLSWILPALIFFGVWFLLARRMASSQGLGGGFMSIGKSRAKIYVENKTGVTFADVAGVDEAKAELQEVVEFLKEPKKYGRLGARVPKGVLLVGPPGTGKTLLARAVAGEAGVPFFSISGSEFVEMFVGVGAARVRDLFEQARQKAPAIIFIDELDALGRARGAGAVGGHDEKEQTLNQLLVEMDGFDPSSGLVLIAATNRPEILDPALLRAGRFDRVVLVDRPERKGRLQILQVHARKVRLAPDVDLEKVAALTPGFSGADLANLVNEAALLATRRGADAVAVEEFNQANDGMVAGLEKKNRVLNETERRVVAHHEMGHAMVAMALPGTDPVHKISIIPRGVGALGYTIQRPTEDRFLMTRSELENKMAVLLGGRAAEEVIFGLQSTGAANDLAKVTDIAHSMVMRYAMVESLGHIAYEVQPAAFPGVQPFQKNRQYSEATAREIDIAVRDIVDAVYEKAKAILTRERAALERWAQKLLEKETLGESELAELRASLIPA